MNTRFQKKFALPRLLLSACRDSWKLRGINNFIKTKLNRVIYETLGRATRRYRRYLINDREYNLLDFLITETEPVDPFSEQPSKMISIQELFESIRIQKRNH